MPGETDGLVDSVHHGAVAVVDATGRLLHSVGDPATVVFPRSALKVFQAIPFMESDGPAALGFDSEAVALLCASHNGEACHVAVVQRMLDRAGCEESALRCGCHTPNFYSWQRMAAPADLVVTQVHNTCSGKHAGFLGWCRLHGADMDNYVALSHPLQQAIARAVSRTCEVPLDSMPAGSDNCSAPSFGIPLRSLALGYAKLARGEGVLGELSHSILAHPYLGSGQHRNDVDLMNSRPGEIISKIGAGSIQAIGIRSAGIGIAVKVSDGNRWVQIMAAIEVLRQLGIVSQPEQTSLAKWARREVRNHVGQHVGMTSARFLLRRH